MSFCIKSTQVWVLPARSRNGDKLYKLRLSEHHPSFLEVVGDFTDTSFGVNFHSFYDLSVIN